MRCFLALIVTLCACDGAAEIVFVPFCPAPVPLTAAEVETIIAQAASRALADGNAYVITVVNRDGVVVGVFEMTGVLPPPAGGPPVVDTCRAKARTAAFLSSNQHSFNTRTAAFIIADHFPPGTRSGHSSTRSASEGMSSRRTRTATSSLRDTTTEPHATGRASRCFTFRTGSGTMSGFCPRASSTS